MLWTEWIFCCRGVLVCVNAVGENACVGQGGEHMPMQTPAMC